MEAVLLFIIKASLLLLLPCIGIVLWAAPRERREREEEERKRQESAHQINVFAATHMNGWDYVPAILNGDQGFVAMSEDGRSIRYATYSGGKEGHPLIAERTFPVNSILSFDIVTPETTKTITHEEKVPVAVRQKRSTVGRAGGGGVLLGPIGAAAGAASGLSGTDKIEYHTTERQETITVKGDASLVLGLTGVGLSRLKIQFDPPRLADEWWYRIQSAKG